jgi:hypothetical protein
VIVEILGLGALAAAGFSDRERKKWLARMAMGHSLDLGPLIDKHGLKWVSERINAIPDEVGAPGAAKEALLRALEKWVIGWHWVPIRTDLRPLEHVPPDREADWQASQHYLAQLEEAVGVELTLFDATLGGWIGTNHVPVKRIQFPIRVRIIGPAEPTVEDQTLYAYYLVELIEPDTFRSRTPTNPMFRMKNLEMHGPTYRWKGTGNTYIPDSWLITDAEYA